MSMPPWHTITPRHFALDRVGAWLQEEVDWPDGLSLRDTRLHRAWTGRHGRIAFELALTLSGPGSSTTHYLQGIFADTKFPSTPRQAGFTDLRAATLSEHGLGSVRVSNRELAVWCCTPDCDAKLPIVCDLLDESRVGSVLRTTAAASLLPLTAGETRLKCTIKGYRASRRCAVKVSCEGAPSGDAVFVKAYRRPQSDDRAKAVTSLAAHLDARSTGKTGLPGGRVRIPAIIDDDRSKRIVITHAVAGDSVPLELHGDDLALVAGALAMLHSADIGVPVPAHAPVDDFQTVCRWVQGLKTLGASRYLRLRELAIELSSALRVVEPGGRSLIHRDFYGSQLLRDAETLWLVDFDTLSVGHPELDVATLVAHQLLDGLCAGREPAFVSQWGGRFVEAYRAAGGKINPQRLRFYLACATARLGAMHLVRGIPVEAVEALWAFAERSLSDTWDLE